MAARHSTPTPKPWSADETDRLADLIADGFSFGGASRTLGCTRNSCVSRFRLISQQYGWQAA
ncbi:hypothetical protein SKP52_02495 [Sphingopyxis fribergensis]|uniref:Myb-like domain-containing protein n=1 Tax=Sphingopyxis fribergensis TaxID=1515612 RepID=A0A0A7PBV7_9SPHN|nr:hypothetical protein SKP52_02495 [Sphingopyxis fribergensis]